ncbi:MAG TPA: hypothetical protein VK667_12350, partial [Ktedonobacteraceae bacterium]|nr:hypothetical protein [Ktedonobacteraceae bacterium]
MLRASHLNQQYDIGKQVHYLPGQIEKSRKFHAGLLADIATRDANETEKFIMTVTGRDFSGKNAREQAGAAILQTITSSLWEDSKIKHLGHYKGFEILSSFSGREGDTPRLY